MPELGGSGPDRLYEVTPQERVQRCTMEQLVDAVPCLPALDAPVPLLVEQLVTVLAEMEREEDVEMNRLEDRQVIAVPKISLDRVSKRCPRPRPRQGRPVGGSAYDHIVLFLAAADFRADH